HIAGQALAEVEQLVETLVDLVDDVGHRRVIAVGGEVGGYPRQADTIGVVLVGFTEQVVLQVEIGGPGPFDLFGGRGDVGQCRGDEQQGGGKGRQMTALHGSLQWEFDYGLKRRLSASRRSADRRTVSRDASYPRLRGFATVLPF